MPAPTPTRRAVVLENLGTPDSPALPDVQRYLKEFLSDKRIISLPGIIWQPILHLRILRSYAPLSASKYAKIWTDDGSPLMAYTRAQVDGLRERLDPVIAVDYAMRYGTPTLESVVDRLRAEGIHDILHVPMYPQYSTTTIGSVEDDLATYLAARPSTTADPVRVDVLPCWFDDPGYLDACAGRILAAWEVTGRPDFAAGDRLLLSFHGIPVAVERAGDPYPGQCRVTADGLRARLGLDETTCLQTFQSKFGRAAWLTPATIETVAELGRSGVRRVDVFCPGFAADCLETLEEIELLNRAAYLDAGGGEFHRIDCLNADPAWLDALARLISAR